MHQPLPPPSPVDPTDLPLLTVLHLLISLFQLTHTPVSNPNKTHWLTRLDFGVILTLVYGQFPICLYFHYNNTTQQHHVYINICKYIFACAYTYFSHIKENICLTYLTPVPCTLLQILQFFHTPGPLLLTAHSPFYIFLHFSILNI